MNLVVINSVEEINAYNLRQRYSMKFCCNKKSILLKTENTVKHHTQQSVKSWHKMASLFLIKGCVYLGAEFSKDCYKDQCHE